MWFIIIIQAFVPLLVIFMIAVVRQPSRLNWALNTLLVGTIIAFLWFSSPWHISSMHLRHALPVFYVLAALLSFFRIRPPEKPPTGKKRVFLLVFQAILLVPFVGLNWLVSSGYRHPDNAVDLVSPLRAGKFVVSHGGASPFINGHAKVRPQSFALDILALNTYGMRANRLGLPRELTSYEIFAHDVYSPCDGVVAVVEDRHNDLLPPEADSENLAGNHVLVECKGVEVLLAHLMKGSIGVDVGDPVTTESLLAQVGNSGNTSEPHLHLHIERDGQPGRILDGQSVPMTINGRFLVRGDIF